MSKNCQKFVNSSQSAGCWTSPSYTYTKLYAVPVPFTLTLSVLERGRRIIYIDRMCTYVHIMYFTCVLDGWRYKPVEVPVESSRYVAATADMTCVFAQPTRTTKWHSIYVILLFWWVGDVVLVLGGPMRAWAAPQSNGVAVKQFVQNHHPVERQMKFSPLSGLYNVYVFIT